ncbi:helix-turn-helix domain-containing protein [Desulfovermiculus halophilus]|uniref:helix-turn-helix transcriptional regulator n=1 Tax=Desulfovermiculus halophilus TaxID=339722 RepID=UPI00054E77BA
MVTQKEFAKKLNVTPQHLNAVLKGRVRPSLKLALQIEALMGIPLESIIPELKGKDFSSPGT